MSITWRSENFRIINFKKKERSLTRFIQELPNYVMRSKVALWLSLCFLTIIRCSSGQRYVINRDKNGDAFTKNNGSTCSSYQATNQNGGCICRSGTLLGSFDSSLKCYYSQQDGTGCSYFMQDQPNALSTINRPTTVQIGLISFPPGFRFLLIRNMEFWDGLGWSELIEPQLRITADENPGKYLLTWSSQPRNIFWESVYRGLVIKINIQVRKDNTVSAGCLALKFAGEQTVDTAVKFTIPPPKNLTVGTTLSAKTTTTSTTTTSSISSTPSTTSKATVGGQSTEDSSDGSGSIGVILGVIVALLLIFIFILAGVIFYRKRKNLKPLLYFNCLWLPNESSKPQPHRDITIERVVPKDPNETGFDYIEPITNHNAYEEPKFIIESRIPRRPTTEPAKKMESPKKRKESEKIKEPPKKRESTSSLINVGDMFYGAAKKRPAADDTPEKKISINMVQEEEGIYDDPLYQANITESENIYVMDSTQPDPNALNSLPEENDHTDSIVSNGNTYEEDYPNLYESLRVFKEDYIDDSEINISEIPPERKLGNRSRPNRPSLQALVSNMDNI